MEGRREVNILAHRPVTSSDLKQESHFLVGVSQHYKFLPLVVASESDKKEKNTEVEEMLDKPVL